VISAGAIFGEIALLDGLPRTADATAVADCELMVIGRRDFVPLLKEQPEIAIKLIEVLCGRLRQTTEQLEDLMFLDLPGRLAKTLLQLAKKSKPTSRGPRVALTQSDIGKMIGTSRESTNKQLRTWQDRKWLLLERGGIVILAPDALAEIAATVNNE
jgi:CRP/FNR family cyclic AMP-dependent transcriptional regulator